MGMQTKELPRWRTYGNYKSDNYGVNALCFEVGALTVYFSYKTPIAFVDRRDYDGGGLLVRENVWGCTTGKHLNWAEADYGCSKGDRVDGEFFEEQLARALSDG